MDLVTFWFDQLVDELDLNKLSNNAQAAERNLYADNFPAGVSAGLSVAAQNSPNMTVNVTQGVCRTAAGERVSIPSTQIVTLAADSNGNTTSVTGGSNSRIISVFAKFKRNNQTPFVDGNSNPGYEDNLESFELVVVAGAEGNPPSPPALDSTMVLLADVTRAHGQTTITTGDIDVTTRREWAYTFSGSTYTTPNSIAVGKPLDALDALLDLQNGHVSGSIDRHPASQIDYAGSGTWVNSVTGISSGTVEAALDGVVSALAASTATSGAERVGSKIITCPVTGVTLTIAANSVYAHLTALTNPANIGKAVSPAFADTSTVAASDLNTWLNAVVTRLASQSVTPGAQAIGMHQVGGFTGGNVYTDFVQLTQTTSGDDGAMRIGAEVTSGFNAGSNTVRLQLDDLQTNKAGKATANTWTASQSFDSIFVTSGHHYKLKDANGISITRVQQGMWLTNAGDVLMPDTGVFMTGSSSFGVGKHGQFSVMVPDGANINSVSVYIAPSTHASIASTTLPVLYLYKRHKSTGVLTEIANQPDGSGDAAAYSAAHAITISGLTETVDRTNYYYFIKLTVETGSNAAPLLPPPVEVVYTAKYVDDGY